MKKTYFFQGKLASGEYVNLIYESASRKGTFPHTQDLWEATLGKVELAAGEINKDTSLFSYLLNDRNKYDQCFEDYRTVDLR